MSEQKQKRTMLKRLSNWSAGIGLLVLVALGTVWLTSGPVTAQLGAVQTWAGTATGSANSPSIAIHNVGQLNDLLGVPLRFLPSGPNTGTTQLTIRLDSGGTLGPLNVLKASTSGSLAALIGSELQGGQIATVTYDGTQFECGSCGATIPPGLEQDFSGITIPTGWLKSDGSAVSRTTFAGLFNTISNTAASANTTNTVASVVVPNSAIFQVGWSVGGANVVCNATISSIPDGTHIVLSNAATGSGATTLTIGPYPQGDCSTTFNLPNRTGRLTAGVDGSTNITATTCVNAGSLGSNCGSQTKTLVTANLPPYTPTGTVPFALSPSVSSGGVGPVAANGSQAVSMNPQGGTSTPVSSLPPVALVYKIIKT